MIWHVAVALILSLLIFFLSLAVSAVNRLSRVSLRALADRNCNARHRLLSEMAADRVLFLIPLESGIHAAEIGITLLCFLFLTTVEVPYALLLALVFGVLVDVALHQFFPRLLTMDNAERVLLRFASSLSPIYAALKLLSLPTVSLLLRARSSLNNKHLDPQVDDEAGEEEIQAYIGVGAEEGIFEQDEKDLIQSALEFGNTLVREIMTPRNEIIALEDTATIGELREAFISSKHSRLPIYRESIDQIVGVAYIRSFLAYQSKSSEAAAITPIINECMYVPETKKVSDLLKEFQSVAGNLAIVVNEYGAVTGMVTTEDLVEEIVGEIHDEDELRRIDVLYEGEGSYIVHGGVELEIIEDTLDLDFGSPDVTTISGLVVHHLGHVPAAGETAILNGLAVEVLKADRRRINSMRIRKLDAGRAGAAEESTAIFPSAEEPS